MHRRGRGFAGTAPHLARADERAPSVDGRLCAVEGDRQWVVCGSRNGIPTSRGRSGRSQRWAGVRARHRVRPRYHSQVPCAERAARAVLSPHSGRGAHLVCIRRADNALPVSKSGGKRLYERNKRRKGSGCRSRVSVAACHVKQTDRQKVVFHDASYLIFER